MSEKLITSKQLSEIINISVYTIQKWVREKKINAYSPNSRTFLFDPDEVINSIKKFKVY